MLPTPWSPPTTESAALVNNLGSFGVNTLDLGPGREPYKKYFSNEVIPLIAGSFELPSAITHARKWKRGVNRALRSNAWVFGATRTMARLVRVVKQRVRA